jgi:hypothetical protein
MPGVRGSMRRSRSLWRRVIVHRGQLQLVEEAAKGFEGSALRRGTAGIPWCWGCCGSRIPLVNVFSVPPLALPLGAGAV